MVTRTMTMARAPMVDNTLHHSFWEQKLY